MRRAAGATKRQIFLPFSIITINKLIISPDFTIEDIHKIGEYIVNELYLCVLHPNLIEYTADTKSQNANTKCVYYNYNITKDMTPQERRDYYNKCGMEVHSRFRKCSYRKYRCIEIYQV